MHQRPGDVDAPPLSAGELAQRALEQVAEVQKLRKLVEPLRKFPSGDAVQRRAAGEVVPHRQAPVQRGALEHHAQLAPQLLIARVQLGSADAHAAAVPLELTADDVDGGGLARAVHAQKGEQLSLPNLKAQVLHRLHVAEALAELGNFQYVFHGFLPMRAQQPSGLRGMMMVAIR